MKITRLIYNNSRYIRGQTALTTILVLIAILLINICFGYWRSNTRKLTFQWILAIHIPVPVAIVLRLTFLGWNWLMLPAFVAAFAAGQFAGGWTRSLLGSKNPDLGSFLLKDIYLALFGRLKRTSQS